MEAKQTRAKRLWLTNMRCGILWHGSKQPHTLVSRTGRVRQSNVPHAFVSNSSIVIIAGRRPWFFSAKVFHIKFVSPLCIYFINNLEVTKFYSKFFCTLRYSVPRGTKYYTRKYGTSRYIIKDDKITHTTYCL